MGVMIAVIILWALALAIQGTLSSIDAELAARLVAALLLFLHPVHEQKKGFRVRFNLAARESWEGDDLGYQRLVSNWPLSRRMNRLQALALATVFPVLALFGPWWALAGLVSFYLFDAYWTHGIKQIPGMSSAIAGCLGSVAALWYSVPHPPGLELPAAFIIGAVLLALPWIMAYRSVIRG